MVIIIYTLCSVSNVVSLWSWNDIISVEPIDDDYPKQQIRHTIKKTVSEKMNCTVRYAEVLFRLETTDSLYFSPNKSIMMMMKRSISTRQLKRSTNLYQPQSYCC